MSSKTELISNLINIQMTYDYFVQIPYTKRFYIYISRMMNNVIVIFRIFIQRWGSWRTPISIFDFLLV